MGWGVLPERASERDFSFSVCVAGMIAVKGSLLSSTSFTSFIGGRRKILYDILLGGYVVVCSCVWLYWWYGVY